MRYRVTFCVDVDADDERDALTCATDAVEGFPNARSNADVSHTIEEAKETNHEARNSTDEADG